ncbi:TPA: hypothetical protein ACGW44_005485 [Bacillus toyonensis]
MENEITCCQKPKRTLFEIHREFKLASSDTNETYKEFFVTKPSFLASNLTMFLTVMNSSTTSTISIVVKSGCSEIKLKIELGSTGNFYVKQVTKLLYRFEDIEKPCTNQEERATVIIDSQISRNY